jgi:D-inositol-3-phosphate glycosyltransferase
MRILMISDHADPLAPAGSKEVGGQNIYVYYLAKFLTRLGVNVDVFTRWDRRNKKQIVRINNNLRVIRIKAGPKGYMPRDNFLNIVDEFTDNLLKLVKKEKLQYDVIHSNYWFSALIGLKVKNRLKIPMAHVYHSIGQVRFETLSRYKMQKKDYEFFQKRIVEESRIAHESKSVITTSPIEKKIITKLFGVKPAKVKMIPIGIDSKIFHSTPTGQARKRIKFPEKGKLILYVGRIEWRKGIGTLLFAFREVIKQHPSAKLYIVGGGKTKSSKKLDAAERDRLSRIVNQLKLHDNVKFVGAVNQENLRNYYAAADVTVVPSYYEPFGIVPLESMACGTPVVVSKTGGLQYTVVDGNPAFLMTLPTKSTRPSNKAKIASGKMPLNVSNLCSSGKKSRRNM